MSYLFKIRDKVVYPNEETLLVPPFDEIWERDKSSEKEQALKEFAYIEFMTSFLKTNPYRGYKREKREEVIKEDILKDSSWCPDECVIDAMNMIERFQYDASPSYSLYRASLKAKDNLEEFLEDVDLSSAENRTDKGAMVLKPKDITSALLDVEKVTLSLNTLENKIQEEIYEETRIRAGKNISIFAKMESFK